MSIFFCILREVIFAIVKDWVFLLGINFCAFQEIAFNKQLLDEVFVTSSIIEVEVGVISRSRRLGGWAKGQ